MWFDARIGLVGALALLAACGSGTNETESADDFAARIGTGQQGQAQSAGEESVGNAPVPGATGQDGQPLRRTVVPGTFTDPAARSCGAPEAEKLLGRIYSEQLDDEIAGIIPANATFRPVPFGRSRSGPRNPNRLNLMLDQSGIIRDLRCG